jgi:hypothetical protein
MNFDWFIWLMHNSWDQTNYGLREFDRTQNPWFATMRERSQHMFVPDFFFFSNKVKCHSLSASLPRHATSYAIKQDTGTSISYDSKSFVIPETMWRSRRSSSSSSHKRHQLLDKLNRKPSVFGEPIDDCRDLDLTSPQSQSRAFEDSTRRFTIFSIVLGLVLFCVICFSIYQRANLFYNYWLNILWLYIF